MSRHDLPVPRCACGDAACPGDCGAGDPSNYGYTPLHGPAPFPVVAVSMTGPVPPAGVLGAWGQGKRAALLAPPVDIRGGQSGR